MVEPDEQPTEDEVTEAMNHILLILELNESRSIASTLLARFQPSSYPIEVISPPTLGETRKAMATLATDDVES
jgi:hypothetical protein